MSNEYKEWLRDMAEEYLLDEVYMIKRIEWVTSFNGGYLMICEHVDHSKGVYFVWNDEDCGWSYKFIEV